MSQFQNISSGNDKILSPGPNGTFSITVEQLGKKFSREWIFRNFNYSFQSGEVYAITGPNGSGKSTLMQILWGQMPGSTGAIKYTTYDTEISHEEVYKHVAVATPYLDL